MSAQELGLRMRLSTHELPNLCVPRESITGGKRELVLGCAPDSSRAVVLPKGPQLSVCPTSENTCRSFAVPENVSVEWPERVDLAEPLPRCSGSERPRTVHVRLKRGSTPIPPEPGRERIDPRFYPFRIELAELGVSFDAGPLEAPLLCNTVSVDGERMEVACGWGEHGMLLSLFTAGREFWFARVFGSYDIQRDPERLGGFLLPCGSRVKFVPFTLKAR